MAACTACRLPLLPGARAAPPAPQERRARAARAPGARGATYQGARASGRPSPSLTSATHRLCECDLVAPAQKAQGNEECGLACAEADSQGGGLRTRMAMVLVQDGNASPWTGLLQAGARAAQPHKQEANNNSRAGDEQGARYPLARALFTGSSRARQKVAPCCLWRRRWGRRPCAQPARSTAAVHAAFATHSSAEAQAQRTGATQGEHASCARAHG